MRIYPFNHFLIERFCKKHQMINYEINKNGINADTVCLNQINTGFKGSGYTGLKSYNPNYGKIPFKFNKVKHVFRADKCGLNTLKNFPEYVGSDLYIENNNLTTLIYGPKYVGGNYQCEDNNLKDVYGFPEIIDGGVSIGFNPVYEIIDLSSGLKTKHSGKKYENIKFIQFLNEYSVIRNGDTVIESRLEDALFEIGKKIPENLEFSNYKLI